ncbi:NusG domain II-containing protein [Lactococcus cremoris]|uniref:NusG domain II-containing protein n=1 Tax=Lactococcus lactis subsp. cremoris TaxID=1359 RepID=A0AAX4A4G6_LACLC|nr:NusG domain II-containing protein [Lactococcus cremoris]KGH33701.1 transporter [Lactococcus cremoris]QSE64362.1 NusG domain II-containing protein [Lactococcus cremoris]WMX70047.1 NusG domain II-containing protein [Lactococcus cremoris]
MNFFKNTIIFLKTIKTKPLDFVIIFVLFLASFSTIFLFATGSTGAKAELRISGKVIKTFDLKKNQTWTYRAKYGDYNKIEVKNGEIAVVEANCKDQIDVQRGFISKTGETIVCLPHNLVIEVMSGQKDEQVDYKV